MFSLNCRIVALAGVAWVSGLPTIALSMGDEWYLSESSYHKKSLAKAPLSLQGQFSAQLSTLPVPDDLLLHLSGEYHRLPNFDPNSKSFKILVQMQRAYARPVILVQTVQTKPYAQQLLYLSLYLKTQADRRVRAVLARHLPALKGRMVAYLHCPDNIYEYQTNPEFSIDTHDWHRQSTYVYVTKGCLALSIGVLMQGYGTILFDDVKVVEKGVHLATDQSFRTAISGLNPTVAQDQNERNFIKIVRQLANTAQPELLNLDFEQFP